MIATKFHKQIETLSPAQINAYVMIHCKAQKAAEKQHIEKKKLKGTREDISTLAGFGFSFAKKK